MTEKISLNEVLRIALTILVVSVLLALVNPFSENYLLSFCVISLMFGGTAWPFHLYARVHDNRDAGSYMAAGAICGALVGIVYSIVMPFFTGRPSAPLLGAVLFGNGGLLLGGLCGFIFWAAVIFKWRKLSTRGGAQAKSSLPQGRIFLNLLGLVFGTAIVNVVQHATYPALLARGDTNAVFMNVYGLFIVLFPLLFFFAHILLVRILLKGSRVALAFILFEIAFLIVNALYSLPIDINFVISVPAIIFSATCFYVLRNMRNSYFSPQQRIMFKYITMGLVIVVTGHILFSAALVFANAHINQKREKSGEWNALFQPQQEQESDENAQRVCRVLEEQLRNLPGASFNDTMPRLKEVLASTNIHFSSMSQIHESRVQYYFKRVDSGRGFDAKTIEKDLMHHVMKGEGLHKYALWKAKYGLFFEYSYDIYFKPDKNPMLNGPYVTIQDSFVVVSIPLKDPLYIKNFWETADLQVPPPYLGEFMHGHKYEFDHVEIWDNANFNYVYDMNGFMQHLFLSDIDFFHVGLRYMAKRERDHSISDMKLQQVSCSYPFRGEIYERPAGISYQSPHYPPYKECHAWQARIYCPGFDQPVRHKTNICRQLGEPFPVCPTP